MPIREAELCRLAYRDKVPASLSAPRTARQKLGVLVLTDNKIAAVAAYPPCLQDANPGAAFGRDFFHINASLMTRQVEILLFCVKNHSNSLRRVKYLPRNLPHQFPF
jgi:hypothetical protein